MTEDKRPSDIVHIEFNSNRSGFHNVHHFIRAITDRNSRFPFRKSWSGNRDFVTCGGKS